MCGEVVNETRKQPTNATANVNNGRMDVWSVASLASLNLARLWSPTQGPTENNTCKQ